MSQTITQIILFFIFINFAVLFGGVEGWFGWNLGPGIFFLWIFVKVFVFLGLGAIIMEVVSAEEHPLLVVGMVFSTLIIFWECLLWRFPKSFLSKTKYWESFRG